MIVVQCGTIHLKDRNGDNSLGSDIYGNKIKVSDFLGWNICVSNGVTEVSDTIGGEPLNHDVLLTSVLGCGNDDVYLYDVTPLPEYDLIKIMHNGDTYNISDTRCDGIEELLAEL